MKTSAGVNSCHAKTAVYVRATTELSDAFAPNSAKMGAYTEEKTAQLHFPRVTTTNVRMEEYAPPRLSTISTRASAFLASRALDAKRPPSSHWSPEASCT